MTNRFHAKLNDQGWTLVELMIAMALSLLVIAGVGQIYLAAKRSYNIQNNLARIQEVGRYATETITADIRRARYWSLLNIRQSGNPVNGTIFAIACPTGNSTWGRMATQGIFGLDEQAGAITTFYPCLRSNWLRGDILTMRYADPNPATVIDPNALYINTSPLSATIFSAGFGPPPPPPATTAFSNNEMVAHTYYVTTSSATECGKTGTLALPALAREELDSSPSRPGWPIKRELVAGVEQLQFQYGVDTDGDGSADRYMDANTVNVWGPVNPATNWLAVKAVRFWLLVRSDCPEQGYKDTTKYQMGNLPAFTPNDGFRRALYTSTVALRQ